MTGFKQDKCPFKVIVDNGDDKFHLLDAHFTDHMNDGFVIHVVACCYDHDVEVEDFIGKPLTVSITDPNAGNSNAWEGFRPRTLSGVIAEARRVELDNHDDDSADDEAEAVYNCEFIALPYMHTAKFRTRSRIFKSKTIADVAKAVAGEDYLQPDHPPDFQFSGGATQATLTQFHESDYEFFRRMLEKKHLSHFYKMGDKTHKLVVFQKEAHGMEKHEVDLSRRNHRQLRHVERFQRIRNTGVAIQKWDISKHAARSEQTSASSTNFGKGLLETQDYAVGGTGTVPTSEHATERMRTLEYLAHGHSARVGNPKYSVGDFLDIEKSKDKTLNAKHIISGVEYAFTNRMTSEDGSFHPAHHGTLSFVHRQAGVGGTVFHQQYKTREGSFIDMMELPSEHKGGGLVGKLMRKTGVEAPHAVGSRGASAVTGLAMARVTDTNDPEKMGRLKIMFAYGPEEETDWARVVRPWAGKNHGSYVTPQVDDEVLVGFVGGDLDRPIIIGSLFNGVTDYPESMNFMSGVGSGFPDVMLHDHFYSGQWFNHSDGGMGGFGAVNHAPAMGNVSEISLHGSNKQTVINLSSSQDIIARAGRNILQTIGNGSDIEVGKISGITFKHSMSEVEQGVMQFFVEKHFYVGSGYTMTHFATKDMEYEAGENRAITVGGDQTVDIGGSLTTTVGNDQTTEVGNNIKTTAGTKILSETPVFHVKSSNTSTIESASKITLKSDTEIELSVGASSITIKPDGIVTQSSATTTKNTPSMVELQCGGNTVTVDPGGILIKGVSLETKVVSYKIAASGLGEVKAGAPMTLQAPLIKIN